MQELIGGSAVSLAKAIRQKEVSVVEVVRAHLDRIEAVNPTLNAVVQVVADRALDEAEAADRDLEKGRIKGPLHGVPVTIKDSLDTAGIVSSWGTVGRKAFIPERDATVVARLRRAGAIVMGKSNTSELTMGGEMTNAVYGATNNPYDPSLAPSGSSGGAAAIVAAGGSALDLGSDTGGSIRDPANWCGITGIKPTFGRTPRTGHAVPFGLGAVDTLTHIGPLARYVEDLAMCLPVICGPDWQDPTLVAMPLKDPAEVTIENLRIATYTGGGLKLPDPDICRVVQHAAKTLADMGARVIETAPEVLGQAAELYPGLTFGDGGVWIWRLLKRAGTDTPGIHLARLIEEAEAARVPHLSTVLVALDRFRSDMLGFMRSYDAIVCPTDVSAATPHGSSGAVDPQKYMMWGHMSAYNLTGWPAAVVRAGATGDGLPVGVQVVGRPWREDVVLAVAGAIENALGGYRPPKL